MKNWYKDCPYCWNEIKEEAIKCQFCKKFIQTDESNSEEKYSKKVESKRRWLKEYIILFLSIICLSLCWYCARLLLGNQRWNSLWAEEYLDKLRNYYNKCYDVQDNIMKTASTDGDLVTNSDIDYILKICEESKEWLYKVWWWDWSDDLLVQFNEAIDSIIRYYIHYKDMVPYVWKYLTTSEEDEYDKINEDLDILQGRYEEASKKLDTEKEKFKERYWIN